MTVHRRDPQTLAAALNDSPAGLAAWIVERRRSWSDCGGDVERRFTKDDLLTTVSIYWFTQTFHTSARLYAEMFRGATMMPVHDRTPEVEAPTGIAVFPEDVFLVPRSVAAERTDLRRWTVMPRGGHFAPDGGARAARRGRPRLLPPPALAVVPSHVVDGSRLIGGWLPMPEWVRR